MGDSAYWDSIPPIDSDNGYNYIDGLTKEIDFIEIPYIKIQCFKPKAVCFHISDNVFKWIPKSQIHIIENKIVYVTKWWYLKTTEKHERFSS